MAFACVMAHTWSAIGQTAGHLGIAAVLKLGKPLGNSKIIHFVQTKSGAAMAYFLTREVLFWILGFAVTFGIRGTFGTSVRGTPVDRPRAPVYALATRRP